MVLLIALAGTAAADKNDAPIAPKETIKLCNGKDLSGLCTWTKKNQRDDSAKVFSVQDGMIRASGRVARPEHGCEGRERRLGLLPQ